MFILPSSELSVMFILSSLINKIKPAQHEKASVPIIIHQSIIKGTDPKNEKLRESFDECNECVDTLKYWPPRKHVDVGQI